MTLLHFELSQANRRFAACWRAWQEQQPFTLPLPPAENELRWDHFPFELYEYFPELPMRAARRIGLAARAASCSAFLWQQSSDGLLPGDQVARAGVWLQAFAQAQLAPLIPPGSPFWQAIGPSYRQFRAGLSAERARLATLAEPYRPAQFAAIVAQKAALPRLTLRAFAEVAGAAPHDVDLRASQRHLYLGLQLYHDVLNWRADYIAGARSYPLHHLLRALAATPAADPAGRQAELAEIGGYFYYSALAEQMLAEAADHFYRAMAAVTDLPPTLWRALLVRLAEKSQRLRRDLAQIRRRQTDPSGRRRATAVAPQTAQGLQDARHAAAHYLAQAQAEDGRWGDFALSGEQSTAWVTGYVGWTLAQTGAAGADLPGAARWLLANQCPGGGWSYNRNWPVDTDSTATVLLFLATQPAIPRAAWVPAYDRLLAQQQPEGGFSTVMEQEAWLARFPFAVRALPGWSAAHPCVTAVAALLLATVAGGTGREHGTRALDYLCAHQQPAGFWHAYWWDGPFYTTCRAVQAMAACDRARFRVPLARARTWLAAAQLPDGGWAVAEHEQGQPFHTALAVLALGCVAGEDGETAAALKRGLRWLLAHQSADGSWPAVPMMLLPSPEILHPWEHGPWRASIAGLDVIVPDWQRLFTTATVLQALEVTATHPAVATRLHTIV